MDPQYKVVSVTAYWMGSPKPVKRVVLQTIIYRQYAAPPIMEFSTDPVIDVTGVLGDENLVSATLAAKVDLTAGIAPAYVQFTISAYGGRTVASQVVDAGNTNPFLGYWYDRGTFHWTWDCSTAANTLYDFQVTAYSSEDYAGNTMHLYPRIQHTLLPLPPGNVVATAGDGAVYVRWGMSPDPNLAHYAVYRTTSAVGWGAAKLVDEVDAPATFFLDRDPTLVNGTEYYYAVVAVMLDAGRSARSVSGPVTPQDSVDTAGPVAPSFINATPASAAATVALTWGAPTDLDVWAYEVWRSADGNDWGPSPLAVWTNMATLSYSDSSAGWNTTWHYRIRALDGTLNEGAWSATASATTVSQPFHDLRISVQNGNHACNVWVLNAADQHYYNATGVRQDSTPPGVPIARNSSVTFTASS